MPARRHLTGVRRNKVAIKKASIQDMEQRGFSGLACVQILMARSMKPCCFVKKAIRQSTCASGPGPSTLKP